MKKLKTFWKKGIWSKIAVIFVVFIIIAGIGSVMRPGKEKGDLSTSEKNDIRYYVEDTVKEFLKSPSSAEFPGGGMFSQNEGWNMRKEDNLVTVSSYVDSDNSFGANIRTDFWAQVKIKDDGDMELTYLKIDDTVYWGEEK